MGDGQASSGDGGPDEILDGSAPGGDVHPAQTPPGAGEGPRRAAEGLRPSLGPIASELALIAASPGRDVMGIETVEPHSSARASVDEWIVLQAADLGLERGPKGIEAASVEPRRMVHDRPLEFRPLVRDAPRDPRRPIGLGAAADPHGIAVTPLDPGHGFDAHRARAPGPVRGAFAPSEIPPAFGGARRRIAIARMRDAQARDGRRDRGVVDFPGAAPPTGRSQGRQLGGSGGEALLRPGDERAGELLGAGPEPGAATLVAGRTGMGESTLHAAVVLARSERVASSLFGERSGTVFRRPEDVRMRLRKAVDDGRAMVFDHGLDEVPPGRAGRIARAEAGSDGLGVVALAPQTGDTASPAGAARLPFGPRGREKCLARRGILTVVAQCGPLGAVEGGARLAPGFVGDTASPPRMREGDGRALRSAAEGAKRRTTDGTDVGRPPTEPGVAGASRLAA